MPRLADALSAVSGISSGQRVFVHGGSATPLVLLDALLQRAPELRNVELMHLHTAGVGAPAEDRYAGSFRVTNLFVGENMRGRVGTERIDYLPCFLSEIPALFRSGHHPEQQVRRSQWEPWRRTLGGPGLHRRWLFEFWIHAQV